MRLRGCPCVGGWRQVLGAFKPPWPWVPEPLSDQAGVCESVAKGGLECLTSRMWTGCSSAVCLPSTQSTQTFPSLPPTFLPFLLPSSLIHSALAWICYVPCPQSEAGGGVGDGSRSKWNEACFLLMKSPV